MRPNPWATFATCCLSLFLVSLDVTALNVALPGVALAGSIAAEDARQPSFANSLHPFWWFVAASGAVIVALALISTGERARRSVVAIAALVEP